MRIHYVYAFASLELCLLFIIVICTKKVCTYNLGFKQRFVQMQWVFKINNKLKFLLFKFNNTDYTVLFAAILKLMIFTKHGYIENLLITSDINWQTNFFPKGVPRLWYIYVYKYS